MVYLIILLGVIFLILLYVIAFKVGYYTEELRYLRKRGRQNKPSSQTIMNNGNKS